MQSSARAFGLPRFPAAALRLQFFEAGERGVEVCLVEYFAAAEEVTLDRENLDHSPLGVKALLRGPLQRLGHDGSDFAEPMHRLDVDVDVRGEVQHDVHSRGQINPLDPARPVDGRCRPDPASTREVRAG